MMASMDFTSSGLGAGTLANGSVAACAEAAVCGAGFSEDWAEADCERTKAAASVRTASFINDAPCGFFVRVAVHRLWTRELYIRRATARRKSVRRAAASGGNATRAKREKK